ncbi:UDP:flavonoid glycosyltransferase YjiC (YdhE family) [Arthrobacter sp. V4I6]|uniref:glycosyltransferase n=1 Tax=unclassified Arthrobacter TaxID=235627 RepID=UPI002784195B|nr:MULTISPECIES: nucleotide disphospho-sugar-binding domain-containing protein [unclassified Arthrobacter]MDQ0821666.1 UDP:flavonoid glycosyltransferase YjiC (YdhE family) [Arthrobacter sp. V1I7]MDQ0855930.1 UDP:flavonoid glycosyltransferase YjiC (YdhE family) [Arthrobacter sp. V4I6]
MASVLVCSSPLVGHVTPMLAVAAGLVEHGHGVRFLAGRRFEDQVARTGASFIPLPPEADFDDSRLDDAFPGRIGLKGPKGIRFDIQEIFMRPGRAQYEAILAASAVRPVDAVLAESLFMGAALLLAGPRSGRPAVINCGIVPLSLASRDTAPYGLGIPPMPGLLGRVRNRALQTLTERVVFGPVQKYADHVARDVTGSPFPTFFMDWPRAADRIAQFTVPDFEYPRSDLPGTVHFVGPVSSGGKGSTGASGAATLPPWWDDLDAGRPVVHVTQGTVANRDFDDLVRPTVEGLAQDDVLVVVSTGGRPVDTLSGPLPDNVRVASYLPYDELLPRTDVLVTNGGYGGVQFALRHGVPLVVAGQTEEKPEVCARVAWSGTGINLRTNRARPQAVARAVRAVLSDSSYREASSRIGSAIRASRGVDGLADLVADVCSGSPVERE